MAKHSKKLKPIVILSLRLTHTLTQQKDIEVITDEFYSTVVDVCEKYGHVIKEHIIRGEGITVPFTSTNIEKDIVDVINCGIELKNLWLTYKQQYQENNIAIAIHKAAFPGGRLEGFSLECIIALREFAQKIAEETRNSKLFLSRDCYDILESAKKDIPKVEFIHLGLQKFEDIPPMTVYEIREKKEDETKKGSRICTLLTGIPKITTFVGRIAELKKMETLITTNNAMLIYGTCGIGKTTLAAKFAFILKDTYHVFWFAMHEDPTEEEIFAQFNVFLCNTGNTSFERYYQNIKLSFDEKLQGLIESLQEGKYALFFDSEEYIIRDGNVKQLLCTLDSKLTTSVFIFIAPRKVEFLKNACDHAIMLQELTLEEGVEFLKQFGLRDLPEEMLQEIIKKIGSNPFVLKHFIGLIQRHWYSPQELIQELPRYKEEIEKCIIEKLFADVSIEEKNLLFLLSLLRKPVNNKLSKCIYKLSDFEEKLYSLLKFFVFIEYENEYYKVHPLTKRISLLQNRDIKRIHQYIAECFDKQINANNKKNDINMYLERHYHYFESGATNEAFKGIYDNLYELINAGYLKTIEQLLSKYTPTILKPENWVNLWQCKGIIAETRGDFETAEKYYKEMFQYADKILFHQGKIDALILLGKNASLKGDILHAKEFLIKSAQLAEKIDYKDKLAEVYHQIAEYCSKMGDMEDAKKWNEKAIQISNKKDKEGKEWIL